MIFYKKYLIASFILLISFTGTIFAQFTITNTLKSNNSAGLKIGDNAYLTAASGADINGAGWLRLTEAKTNQKGYMYVMQGFPTTLGVIADFEYVQWRNVSDPTYFGADGFSVFLFNASVSETDFKLGGYGGSLGYATFSNPSGTTGLSGGYLGIGFDAYGNYATNTESRNGGSANAVPNSIIVRGPSSSTYSQSNTYLTRVDLGDRSGTLNAIRQRDEIDYNTVTTSRPASDVFYRRVQISITKPANDYVITIKWRKQNQTTFTEILNYTLNGTTYPIPANLKLGFAASTGGGFNFQEIRNILLTTPGNLRVDSRADFPFACNEKKNTVSFKVEVTNDTGATLNNISFNSKITNAANTLLTPSQFKITSVSLSSGFTNSTIPTSNFTTNEINGVVGLGAKSSGIVTITGDYIRGVKANQTFKDVSNVDTTQITDTDTTNNTATTTIDVKKCSVMSNPSMPARYK